MKPIKHICRSGKFGCPNNCKSKGTFDWNAIPDWSASYFMGEVCAKYKYDPTDLKLHAKEFRTFKRKFIRDVMLVPDNDANDAPKVEIEKPTTTKTTKSPTSLKAVLSASAPSAEHPNATVAGTGAQTPANPQQMDEVTRKLAKIQRENDEKEAKYQAMRTELETLKTSVEKTNKSQSNQSAKVDNLSENLVKYVQETDQKLEQSKVETNQKIDNTRVGLMNSIDRVGSHNKLNEQRINYYETKSQVRNSIIMNPKSVVDIITTREELEEVGFVKVSDMKKAAENLVAQGKALAANRDHLENGKSLISYEHCAIAADASFDQSLKSNNRSQKTPIMGVDKKFNYNTVKEQKDFSKIFGFYDGFKAEFKNDIREIIQEQFQKQGDNGEPPRKIPTKTPPLSQGESSVSHILNSYTYKSPKDSVDCFLQANSSVNLNHEENAIPTSLDTSQQKRRRSNELPSADINDLSNQIQKKFKVSKLDESVGSDNDIRMSSPEYRTAEEDDDSAKSDTPADNSTNDKSGDKTEEKLEEKSEDGLLESPNSTLEPKGSSSPRIEPKENPRANGDDYIDSEADVFAVGTREVGDALSVKPPSLPVDVGNEVSIHVAQIHTVPISEYNELPSERSSLATALDLPVDGCKRKVWLHSKELKTEAPKHYEQSTGDRWTSRWIQYCVPHQFQQLCATIVTTSEEMLKSLDGQDRILYLEAKDQVQNINVMLSNEIPKSIYHGIIQNNCEDPALCWKLFDMFKPFPISTHMIERFNQHILAQLDKESERIAIQILDVNMELITKKIVLPMFNNDNKKSAILFRNFVLEWATKDSTPVEKKRLEKQQSIQKFTTPSKPGPSQPSPSASDGVINSTFHQSIENELIIALI